MWKSIKYCAWEWCLSLCVFLSEATCAFGKIWAGCFSVARAKANPLICPLSQKNIAKWPQLGKKEWSWMMNRLWDAPAWDGCLCKLAELHLGNTCCSLKLKWLTLHTWVIVIAKIKDKCWKKVWHTYSAKNVLVSIASYQTWCWFKANFLGLIPSAN